MNEHSRKRGSSSKGSGIAAFQRVSRQEVGVLRQFTFRGRVRASGRRPAGTCAVSRRIGVNRGGRAKLKTRAADRTEKSLHRAPVFFPIMSA